MKVTVISGEFKGRDATLISQSLTRETRLCGGPEGFQSVTARIDGMLYPVELDWSEIATNGNASSMIKAAM